MNYLLSMLPLLAIGMIILMTGILMNREPGQSTRSALNDSVAWGVGFLVSFGAELFIVASVISDS